jgi:hypothetical protein
MRIFTAGYYFRQTQYLVAQKSHAPALSPVRLSVAFVDALISATTSRASFSKTPGLPLAKLGRTYSATTFSACGPFWPSVTSIVTFCPSFRDLNPSI